MTTYLVTRHPGAVEWMQYAGHTYDQHLTHLESLVILQAGDTVIGSLPINIVYDINSLGVNYVHLSLYIPETLRGKELSAEQLSQLDAKLQRYEVKRLD